MSKELDEFYKSYSARIIAIDDTPSVEVMDGGKFKLLSIEEYEEMTNKIADLETKLAQKDKQLEKLKSDNHALISDNAYQESDIFELNSRIEQLQKQLVESETKRKSLEEKVKFITEEKEENFVDGQKYNELKEQLVESEKSKESYRLQNEQHHLQLLQFYSRLGVEAFGADIHEKALETLMITKDQLAEKEKEIEELKRIGEKGHLNDLLEEKRKENKILIKTIEQANQDKISFAVEQLEKVKELCKTKFEWWENSEWEGNIYDKSDVSNAYFDIEANIDEQIKAINEGK